DPHRRRHRRRRRRCRRDPGRWRRAVARRLSAVHHTQPRRMPGGDRRRGEAMKWMIALALVAASVTRGAHADTPDKRAESQRYFRAGAKAYAAQSFAAAAADFEEAYKALPMPEIAFSAAQAYRRLYRVEPKPEYVKRAVELYRVYLDKVKTGGRVGD